MANKLNKIITLVGPTGAGKTDFSIQLAQHYHAIIINLDSVQIYHELNIGSAKPSKQQLNSVPHYLIDIASINEPKNSFFIFQESLKLINQYKNTHNIILTGGTGLYYKSLLFGMFENPTFNQEYRNSLAQYNQEQLFQLLLSIDPQGAKQLHPNDSIRVIRALEVMHSTGKSILTLREEQQYTPPAEFLLLGINYEPREELYIRINKRVLEMIDNGLVEETQNIQKQYGEIPPALFKIIGYKEIISYFRKEIDLNTAISQIQQNTRKFAKRQLTLFRNMENIHWFHNPSIQEFISYIDDNTESV